MQKRTLSWQAAKMSTPTVTQDAPNWYSLCIYPQHVCHTENILNHPCLSGRVQIQPLDPLCITVAFCKPISVCQNHSEKQWRWNQSDQRMTCSTEGIVPHWICLTAVCFLGGELRQPQHVFSLAWTVVSLRSFTCWWQWLGFFFSAWFPLVYCT